MTQDQNDKNDSAKEEGTSMKSEIDKSDPKKATLVVGASPDETSSEQLNRAKQNLEPADEEDTKYTVPILSPKKDKIYTASIYVVWREDNGEIIAVWVFPVPSDVLSEGIAVHQVQFGWTKPTWEMQTENRQSCQEWQQVGMVGTTNRLKLHRLYLDHHLKEVKGLFDSEGNPVELAFSDEGLLTQETYEKVTGCDVSIVDTAIFLYERDILRVNA